MRWILFPALASCAPGVYDSGASEPVRVPKGTFWKGDLPENPDATTPSIVYAGGVGAVVTAGRTGVTYNGLASKDAFSVAVAFPTIGTGYWTVPVSGPDVTQDGNMLFGLTADFTPEVPPGSQTLSFVALDGSGNAGPRHDTEVCVIQEWSGNNLAACDPDTTPPNAVISLSWDTAVDLDIVIVTPEGKIVRPKAPTTVQADATLTSDQVDDPSTGHVSRDSNGNCAIDGIQVESLVFPGDPPPGDYALYADLVAPCSESYVDFSLTLYQRVDATDGTHPVETTPLGGGELLSIQADQGNTLGTYVTTVTLP